MTNHGYSDWATTEIPYKEKTMWYRLSRREDDYRIECSRDGRAFSQMRICHMWEGAGTIKFGVYACSPEESSFRAIFTGMRITACAWNAHDGQKPDLRISVHRDSQGLYKNGVLPSKKEKSPCVRYCLLRSVMMC